MARTNKFHGTAHAEPTTNLHENNVPRLFGKAPFVTSDHAPYKTKKDGAGRGNWGREGDELEDVEEDYNLSSNMQRRRSNSNGGYGSHKRPSWDGRTKFEVDEDVFDEEN
ncbi:hypothetical protein V1511DRAFT_513414 [Dipodascopsis uninucleata]